MASILALHGFTGCGSDFAPFAPLVGGIWHSPDLPGHGSKPSLDCTPEATVGFVEAERSIFSSRRSRLNTPPPHVLLAYSMGARAALQHALTHSDAWDALILISPNPGIENAAARAERRAVDAKLADRIERTGVGAFIEFWQQTPMIRSQQSIRPEWRRAMQTARERHTPEGLAASLRQFGQGDCPNLWPQLPALTMPTLLITGAQDTKYTRIAERMVLEAKGQKGLVATQSRTHRRTHCIIEAAGHMPQLEAPDATADAIRHFLQTLRSD